MAKKKNTWRRKKKKNKLRQKKDQIKTYNFSKIMAEYMAKEDKK